MGISSVKSSTVSSYSSSLDELKYPHSIARTHAFPGAKEMLEDSSENGVIQVSVMIAMPSVHARVGKDDGGIYEIGNTEIRIRKLNPEL